MLTKVQGIFHNTTKAMRVTLLILYDVMAVLLAEFLALWTRFEFHFSQITPTYLENACKYAAVNILITVAVFAFLKLYSSLWQYASVQEMLNVFVEYAAFLLHIVLFLPVRTDFFFSLLLSVCESCLHLVCHVQ